MSLTTPARRSSSVGLRGPHQIAVAYQPLVALGTDRLVGAEALVRTAVGPTHAVVRAAELAGRSERIDRAVLRLVVADLRLDTGHDWPVHVNVSAASLARPSYLSAACALLEAEPRAAGRLVFEVTETAPLPSATAVRRFAASVRSTGARIAVDDATVGYDRLHAISLLEPEVVKLDGGTLRRSLQDATERLRLHAVSSVAHELGATLVAEGIETPAHLEAAMSYGAQVGQGYLFGRPRRCGVADLGPRVPDRREWRPSAVAAA